MSQTRPPLPPGWQSQWDANARRYVFIETATGRSQLVPPGATAPVNGARPLPAGRGAPRHGVSASISGPIRYNSMPQQRLVSPAATGPSPAAGGPGASKPQRLQPQQPQQPQQSQQLHPQLRPYGHSVRASVSGPLPGAPRPGHFASPSIALPGRPGPPTGMGHRPTASMAIPGPGGLGPRPASALAPGAPQGRVAHSPAAPNGFMQGQGFPKPAPGAAQGPPQGLAPGHPQGQGLPKPAPGHPQGLAPNRPPSLVQHPVTPNNGVAAGAAPGMPPQPGPVSPSPARGLTHNNRRRQYAAYTGESISVPPSQLTPAFQPGHAHSASVAPSPRRNGLSHQFSHMNLGAQAQQQPIQPFQPNRAVSTAGYPSYAPAAAPEPALTQYKSANQSVNLINLQLDPNELYSLRPPEIQLPEKASFSTSPQRIVDPSYQRSTVNAIPVSNSLVNKSKVPLALIVTPYRTLKAGDPEVPVVSDTVIARCRRCRTYINPYVTFVEGSNRWKCCMCGMSNEVPQMFDWDQEKDQPANRYERAELNSGVVEFIAPTEYMVRPPQAPTYVFVIDVSYSAVASGMVATAARTLLESLDQIPNVDGRTKIALIAVDSCLHFFSLSEATPSILVVADLDPEDVFVPKPNSILVSLTEARPAIENLLTNLHGMFRDNDSTGNALGAALTVAHQLVKNAGGKIMVLSTTIPNMGPGALKNREDHKLLGTTKESQLLQPQNSFYKSLAIECSRAQVSVDMWLFSSTYTDVATLCALPRYTGGQTFLYAAFNAARPEDARKFAHEFSTVVTDPICLEAVMRVRASRGIRMSAFHGNFFVRSTDLLALPAVPMDQSYAIEFEIEDPLVAPFVVFQTAVLHTTSFGERRIRVITVALPTTSSLTEIYSSVDQQALISLFAARAVERSLQNRMEDARDQVQQRLTEIMQTYKSSMTSLGSGPHPQLLLGENLKFLPLLVLGLLKNIGLRATANVAPDIRAAAMCLLSTMPTQLLIPYLHPALYALHSMSPECGTIGPEGAVILPPALPLSSQNIEPFGLYLLEDGQNILLWIGKEAVPQLVHDVFGVDTYAAIFPGKATLPELGNDYSQRIHAIIGKIREQRRGPYYANLYVIKEDGDLSLRQWFLSLLIDDRQDQLPSYPQFLGRLKDKINV